LKNERISLISSSGRLTGGVLILLTDTRNDAGGSRRRRRRYCCLLLTCFGGNIGNNMFLFKDWWKHVYYVKKKIEDYLKIYFNIIQLD